MDTLEDAVRSEQIVRVRQLLDTPGAVSHADMDYALTVAAGNRALDIARLLLDCGAAVDGGDDPNASFAGPLHQAVLHCNAPLVKLLAVRGADLNRLSNGRTALSLAAGSADHLPVLRALLDAGADPNAHGTHFFSLGIAVLSQNEDALAALLAAGADPNLQVMWSAGALHTAAMLSLPRFVEALLAAGADPNLRARQARITPLHHAAAVSDLGAASLAVVRLLLKAGAEPLAPNDRGCTALATVAEKAPMPSADWKQGAVAALLIAAGDYEHVDRLPPSCPGVEAALVAGWRAAPEHLPALFSRLEPRVQGAVRCLLRLSHRHGLPKELRWRLAGEALGDAGRDLGLY